MAQVSKRFYANKATQKHQRSEVIFGSFHSDNIGETVEFLMRGEESYMRVSMAADEAEEVAGSLLRFARLLRERVNR